MHVHIGHTFFGAGNFGDDLVIGGFLKGIADSIPQLKITCATPFDRDAQARRFPQIEWSTYDPASRRMLIVACDVWLGLGGTIFHELDDSWLLADQLLRLDDLRIPPQPALPPGGSDQRLVRDRSGCRGQRNVCQTGRLFTGASVNASKPIPKGSQPPPGNAFQALYRKRRLGIAFNRSEQRGNVSAVPIGQHCGS
jgi:hypothetical protein